MLNWFRETWCDLFHAGGEITRDRQGRINWRCRTCGRWATPVPLDEERRVIDRELEAYRVRNAKEADHGEASRA